MKALLVDDEQRARSLLQLLIEKHCPSITEITQAVDIPDGVDKIKSFEPDIVFLDIEMPGQSGLDIFDHVSEHEVNFQIIFVTAFNEYALDAFKLNAIDYLVKPIDRDDLTAAVSKAVRAYEDRQIKEDIQRLRNSIEHLKNGRMALAVPKGVIFLAPQDILYLEADGMYTTLYLRDGTKEVICKPLAYFTKQLAGRTEFYDPHRSYIINMSGVKQYTKKDGGFLTMTNGKSIPISRYKRADFLKYIEDIF